MNLNLLHRIRAKGVLKGNWAIALLAALIASVPSLLMQIVSTRVVGNWYEKLIRAYYTAGTAFETEAQQLGLQLREAAPLLVGTLLIAIVLTPVLHVGQRHYTLGLLRGEEPDVTAVFRRLRAATRGLCDRPRDPFAGRMNKHLFERDYSTIPGTWMVWPSTFAS